MSTKTFLDSTTVSNVAIFNITENSFKVGFAKIAEALQYAVKIHSAQIGEPDINFTSAENPISVYNVSPIDHSYNVSVAYLTPAISDYSPYVNTGEFIGLLLLYFYLIFNF